MSVLTRLRTTLHHLNQSRATSSSTVPFMNTSKACCTLPPVTTHEYEPKGKYQSYGSINKAYITGPEGTGKTIIVVYDIFGYFPQTLQGADRLAIGADAKVVLPEFWAKPIDIALYPPKNDEEINTIQTFFKTTAKMENMVALGDTAIEQARADGAKKVGLLGYCYGAKVAINAAAAGKVDAIACNHPAFITAESDAESLKCPIAFFPSKDEDKAAMETFMEAVSKKPFASQNVYKYYEKMIHGWSAARGDLSDPEVVKDFEDVYDRLSTFFSTTLASE